MRGDARSRRVAIVPDTIVNPEPGAPDRLAQLAAEGWGVVALPPTDSPPEVRAGLLAAIVEQVVAFLDDDYDVVCLEPADEEVRRFQAELEATGRGACRTLSLEDPASSRDPLGRSP